MKLRLPRLATILVTAAIIASAGCATRAVRPPDPVEPAPQPNSASGALRLLEWAYNNRNCEVLRELFTEDFVFRFSSRDSAGADYRTSPWTLVEEFISTCHLFDGGSAEAPASSITLLFDRNLTVLPDPRYLASDPVGRWHKTIATQVLLNIRTTDGSTADISGQAIFYFVRGDSALIPEELRNRGWGPDSTRWWIQRWDDETVQDSGGGLATAGSGAPLLRGLPSRQATWGGIKVLYLPGVLSSSVATPADVTRIPRRSSAQIASLHLAPR
jgi:hypothetical protein